ncbi:hypothetical protein MMC30_001171 [Trapelia coarctata]|nr:hypothetical protein [Trapelia coarctata]
MAHLFAKELIMTGEYTAPLLDLITHAVQYRPGYHYRHVVDTSLLRTCRRIYLETYLLPAKLNEVVLWGVQSDRAPPDAYRYLNREADYWSPIRTVEQKAVSRFHLFTQQYWMEGKLANLFCIKSFQPSILHITIRHTDWWWWESGEQLVFDPKQPGRASGPPSRKTTDPFDQLSWGNAFHYLHGLKQFVLELETIESKKPELDEIISRAKTWQFPLADDGYLVLDPKKTKYSAWRGLNRFDNDHAGAPVSPYQTPRLKPKVVGMMEDMLEGTADMDPALIACIPPLDGPNVEAFVPSKEKIQAYLGQQHTAHDYAQLLGHYRRTKWCVESGATVLAIQTGTVKLRDDLQAQFSQEVHEELEELNALQYYVVKMTWNAKRREPEPAPVASSSIASTNQTSSGAIARESKRSWYTKVFNR